MVAFLVAVALLVAVLAATFFASALAAGLAVALAAASLVDAFLVAVAFAGADFLLSDLETVLPEVDLESLAATLDDLVARLNPFRSSMLMSP